MLTAIPSKFPLGQVVATPGAIADFGHEFIHASIQRHAQGDWGDLDEDDKKTNDDALTSGEDRIFSAYKRADGEKLWVITEWNRSVTTALKPDEY